MCVTCDFTGGLAIFAIETDTTDGDVGCATPGQIVQGCLSLDYDTTVSACRPCETYGRDVNTYDWITGVCQFECNDEYY